MNIWIDNAVIDEEAFEVAYKFQQERKRISFPSKKGWALELLKVYEAVKNDKCEQTKKG